MIRSRTLGTILAVLFVSLVPSTVHAIGANRIFVSARTGSDANTCANVNTPCLTLTGAVRQVNPGGEVIILDSGGYGPVTITQALTIEAPSGVTAFIHPSSGDAITVNAGESSPVVLRGLVLNGGPSNGIVANTFGALYIESCVISGFAAGSGIEIAGSGKVFVKDTISRQNGNGIDFDGDICTGGPATIDHCRFDGNSFDGVIVEDIYDVTLRDSSCAGNGHRGVLLITEGVVNVYDSMVTNNGEQGISVNILSTCINGPSHGPFAFASIRVANSSVSSNGGAGLANVNGYRFESLGNNFTRGNLGGDTSGTITVVPPQ